MTYKKMGTIRTTFERCKAENIGVSRNFIRELAISGRIPSIMAGKTRLINFDILMEYLNSGTILNKSNQDEVIKYL